LAYSLIQTIACLECTAWQCINGSELSGSKSDFLDQLPDGNLQCIVQANTYWWHRLHCGYSVKSVLWQQRERNAN